VDESSSRTNIELASFLMVRSTVVRGVTVIQGAFGS
jgi:hypothetical protein